MLGSAMVGGMGNGLAGPIAVTGIENVQHD